MLVTLFTIAALIFSAIIHEYAHGWVAHKLGDDTAKDAGRLTLNPLSHLDPLGSVLVPLILALSKSPFFIAWAKPVPYNPYNLRDPKYGDLKVALGGPGANFLVAAFFGLASRFLPLTLELKSSLVIAFFQGDGQALLSSVSGNYFASLFVLSAVFCFVNLILMIFNLIPLPPLDGSKILITFLPQRWRASYYRIEPYGFFIILALVMFGIINIGKPLFFIFSALTGIY